MTTDNRHKWECVSPGEYDTTYRCSKCGALHTDQADDLSSVIPEFGCSATTDRIDAIGMLKKAIEETPTTTDLKSKTVEEAFEEWEGTEETYRWNMVRAAACHGTPDDSYPFQSGWKAAEKEYSRRLEEVQQKITDATVMQRLDRGMKLLINPQCSLCGVIHRNEFEAHCCALEAATTAREALEEAQQRNAAHDAELTAKAKAEALEDFIFQFGDEDCPPRLVDDARAKAAEYRAKAGRKE